MLAKTKKLMHDYAETLKPSSARYQCRNIACMELAGGETIAHRIQRDHYNSMGHLSAASLMRDAGAAVETDAKPCMFGTFTFEDGSSF